MSQKKIGFFTLLSLILGIMIGAGILVLPSTMSKFGAYGFWAWSVASVAVLNLAFIFSHLTKVNPDCTDPASFVGKFFGAKMSFVVSWWHWFGLTMGTALIAIALTSYALALFNLPNIYALYMALGFIWSVLALQALYTFMSINVLIALTVIKISALLLICFSGIAHINWAALNIAPAPGIDMGYKGMLGALSIALFAFVGIESATLPGQDIENKNVVVPLATIIGAITAAIIYTLTYSVVISVLPAEQLWNTNTPVGDAALKLIGPLGQKLVSILAFIGCIGSLYGCLMGSAFLAKNSAKSAFVPRILNAMTQANFPLAGGVLTAGIVSFLVTIYYYTPTASQGFFRDALASTEVYLVSLVYLWSVISYHYSNGYKISTLIGIISCVGFIFGARANEALIPYQITAALFGAFIYLSFTIKEKRKPLDFLPYILIIIYIQYSFGMDLSKLLCL